jgi:hypothetical protein
MPSAILGGRVPAYGTRRLRSVLDRDHLALGPALLIVSLTQAVVM